MVDEFLIPVGFKDEVNFDTYVEHEYKNKIIEYFKINGFDLVKTPLVEFTNQKKMKINLKLEMILHHKLFVWQIQDL